MGLSFMNPQQILTIFKGAIHPNRIVGLGRGAPQRFWSKARIACKNSEDMTGKIWFATGETEDFSDVSLYLDFVGQRYTYFS